MTPVERILKILDKKGISKNKMLTELGLAKNSFNNWISRGTSPSGETMQKIANYLGVSVDYLLNGTSKVAVADSKKAELNELFDKIPDDKKPEAIKILKEMVEK